jgi:uncharacterized membrane protein
MSILVIFVQIFSSLITVISALGLFGIPEKFQEFGIQVNQLQIAFALSLILTILSFVFARKIRRPDVGRDKKTQFQFGGRNNKQDMR